MLNTSKYILNYVTNRNNKRCEISLGVSDILFFFKTLEEIIRYLYTRTVRPDSMPAPRWKLDGSTAVVQVDDVNGSLRVAGA